MEQTRGLFCTCESGVARCQSQHQCHFFVRSALHGQASLKAVNHILCDSLGYERLQKFKDSLKACFENVNIVTLPSNKG